VTTLVSSLQRAKFMDPLQCNVRVQGEKSEIEEIPLDMDKGSPPLDIDNAQETAESTSGEPSYGQGWLSSHPGQKPDCLKQGRELLYVKNCLVCCFVLFDWYWGIVTVPGFPQGGPRSTYPRNGLPTCHLALSPLGELVVAGSRVLTLTLTTSLAIPIPYSSSSNGPTTTAIDN